MRDTVFVARRLDDDKFNVVVRTTLKEADLMQPNEITAAFQRLTGSDSSPDLTTAMAAITAVAGAKSGAQRLLDALTVLRWAQSVLAGLEPELITAARRTGVSWQALAPALGVASRQAAERRYLRLVPATADQEGSTRDGRVRAERDRRAEHRAVTRWANDNTANLRRLAGQVTALTDLDDSAAADIGRLDEALAGPDAGALPALLAGAQRHLSGHPDLADQIDTVTEHTDRVRRQTQRRRDGAGQAGGADAAAR
ncbi:MAG TPA: hypothetical protein VH502_09195 [Actinoplanes sp.]